MLDLDLLCGYGIRHANGTIDHAGTRRAAAAALADPLTYEILTLSPPRMDFPSSLKRRALWDGARLVLGHDIAQPKQEVGDCVGVSSRHALEFCEIAAILAGKRATFEPIFSPFHWAMGRLAPDCGNNRCGTLDGSMGSWQAKALVKYGCLAQSVRNADGEGLPPYSGAVARQWGNRPGPNPAWVTAGHLHVARGGSPVRSLDDLKVGILSGSPVTVASNQGFTLLPQADGFHHPEGVWEHQMCVTMLDLGEEDGSIPPHAGINNQWDDIHGRIIDFRTNEAWPPGMLRVRLDVLLSMIAANDSFMFTGVDTWYVPDPAAAPFTLF